MIPLGKELKTFKIGRRIVPLWLVAVILISGICSGAVGYYVWTTLNIPFEVKEPIEILQYPSQLSLYSGERLDFNVTVLDHASINYSVVLNFTLSNTTYQESYVTFSTDIYTVVPSQQNLTAWVEVDASAPHMNLTLSIDFKRGVYPSGLVGYWKFDEGSGITAGDSSGNNNNGTLENSPIWVDGKYGKALSFDGVNDYVVLSPLNLSSSDSLTIMAWIKSPLQKPGYVFYHGNHGEFLLHNGERLSDGPVSGRYPKLASFSVKIQGTWYDVYSAEMAPNTWHHIAGVWTKGGSLKIYVDGVLAGENDIIPDDYLHNPGSSYTPRIGDYYLGEPFFEGSIDNVMVYNRALSAEEVTAL